MILTVGNNMYIREQFGSDHWVIDIGFALDLWYHYANAKIANSRNILSYSSTILTSRVIIMYTTIILTIGFVAGFYLRHRIAQTSIARALTN